MYDDGRKEVLWSRYIKMEFFTGLFILVLPAGTFCFFMDMVSSLHYFWGKAINLMILLYVYFGGVIVSAKLYNWKRENVG